MEGSRPQWYYKKKFEHPVSVQSSLGIFLIQANHACKLSEAVCIMMPIIYHYVYSIMYILYRSTLTDINWFHSLQGII